MESTDPPFARQSTRSQPNITNKFHQAIYRRFWQYSSPATGQPTHIIILILVRIRKETIGKAIDWLYYTRLMSFLKPGCKLYTHNFKIRCNLNYITANKNEERNSL